MGKKGKVKIETAIGDAAPEVAPDDGPQTKDATEDIPAPVEEPTEPKRDDAPADEPPKKTKKPKKKFDPLSDDPIKFKNVSFEHALTAEEKAARKAAKKAKGKKPKKPVEEAAPPVTQDEPEAPPPPVAVEEKTKEAKKKAKKGKKKESEAKPEKIVPAKETATDEGGEPAEEKTDAKEKKTKKGKKPKEGGDVVGEKPTKKKGKGKKTKSDAEKPQVEIASSEATEENPEEIEPPPKKKSKGKGKKKGKDPTAELAASDEKATKETKSKKGKRRKSTEELRRESTGIFREKSKSGSAESFESYDSGSYKAKKKRKRVKERKSKEDVRIDVGEAKPKEEAPKEKKEKKGKKKKAKEEGEPEKEEEVVDIMAQIRAMKALAEAQAQGLDTETETVTEVTGKKKKKKEKKKKGPKLSKAQKQKLDAERAEQARVQAELDAVRAIEEEKIRLEQERKAAKEKEKRDISEQSLRIEQITHVNSLIRSMLEYNWELTNKEKDEVEWDQYLQCDGLPNPADPAQMNTYLHLWDKEIENVTVEDVTYRTDQVIKLLQRLDDFIDDPFNVPDSLSADWIWVRSLFRQHQQENIDMATYRLLRDVDSRLNRLDIQTADYNISEEYLNYGLWVLVQLATPEYNPRTPIRPRQENNFPPMKLSVLFPTSMDVKYLAIRAMYLKYDHLSDTCATYNRPPIPADYDKDIFDSTAEEWYTKVKYKYDHRKRKRLMIEDDKGNLIEGPEEPEPELAEGELPPIVAFQKLEPSASEIALAIEDGVYAKNKERLMTTVPEHILNLRKFIIIGGIYCIDLFYQPPQPKDMVAFEIRLTTLQVPKRIQEVPFSVKYSAPPPAETDVRREPEEIEEEIKKLEEEMDKLILVTLTLPEHVMFLDLPTVVHWDKDKSAWSSEDVHDVKHIEEKGYLTFRTGLFGQFGLAVNRYLNFPFQAWEIKPEDNGTVTFQLTCAILMIEFNIKGNRICVTQLQNGPNNALQEIVGVYYKLPKLMRVLLNGGVDVFPGFDASCYVEGACEKHWPMEKHLYYNMAQLYPCFNFTWSRWNIQAGRRNAVMQMREYRSDRQRQKNFMMLLVTPLKACYIDCTEITQTFNDAPLDASKFYSDLYQLMKSACSISVRSKVQDAPQDVVKALSDLLIATRILSFS